MGEEIRILRKEEKTLLCLPDLKNEEGLWVQMLEENQIEGMLKLWVHIIDGKRQYYYEACGMQSLGDTLQKGRGMQYDLLKRLIQRLVETISSAPEYFLKKEAYLLMPKEIFWNQEEGKIYLCYYGESERTLSEQLQKLAEFVICHVRHEEREAEKLAYEFYNMAAEGISLEEMRCLYQTQEEQSKKIAERIKEEKSKTIGRKEKEEAGEKIWYLAWQQDTRAFLLQCLCGSKSRAMIYLDRLPCIIGRDVSADYCIKNSGISRSHLRIERRGGDFYVTDLHSSNGTILNGKRMKPGIPIRIREGDRIILAGEVFCLQAHEIKMYTEERETCYNQEKI